jgi:hypothetical protein
MKLEKLRDLLKANNVSVNLKEMKDESMRLYVRLDKQFTIYFIEWDEEPFLKVYIARSYGFDYRGLKQSDLENDRCKVAKLEVLQQLKAFGIDGLEEYSDWQSVKLGPTQGCFMMKLGENK